ncbi:MULTISPECIES: hypothetical protein [unclassified Haladaptatus]|uniref:DUF7556 family protein n=1 Tax=unclassified Haladaptatus TaxID=2622732 RepID=UPI0023E7EF7C|nr:MULTISPECIES: hypothetical protein [unclassified Haladaptatus]
MAPDITARSEPVFDEAEVMASVDESGSVARLIIADICRDDAWVSCRAEEAVTLSAWA